MEIETFYPFMGLDELLYFIKSTLVVLLHVFYCTFLYHLRVNVLCKIYYKTMMVMFCLLDDDIKIWDEMRPDQNLGECCAALSLKMHIVCVSGSSVPVATALMPVTSASGNRKRQLIGMTDGGWGGTLTGWGERRVGLTTHFLPQGEKLHTVFFKVKQWL